MTSKEKFNELMITIGNYVFDLQFIITGVVCDILDEMKRESLEINVEFPYRIGNNLEILTSEKIAYDNEDERLFIMTVDGMLIQWTDLDVSVQEKVAQEVHMEYVSDMIYRGLSLTEQEDEDCPELE
jgi:hypothetical protein